MCWEETARDKQETRKECFTEAVGRETFKGETSAANAVDTPPFILLVLFCAHTQLGAVPSCACSQLLP